VNWEEILIPRDWIEILAVRFFLCEGLSPAQGAAQLIQMIYRLGGGFLKADFRQVEPDPFREITPRGILRLYFEHDLLEIDTHTYHRRGKGRARLSVIPDERYVMILQNASFPELRKADLVAHGLLRLTRLLYPELRPQFGSIDELGENDMTAEEIAALRLRYVFWANLWGPSYVAEYGQEFLLGAPGWRVEALEDGGILYVPTESYVDWWLMARLEQIEESDLKESIRLRKELEGRWDQLAAQRAKILNYFRERIPEIELYWSMDWD